MLNISKLELYVYIVTNIQIFASVVLIYRNILLEVF